MIKPKILVIGAGKVGTATADRISLSCEVYFHDPFKDRIVPDDDWEQFETAIVCVDTLQTGLHDHDDLKTVIEKLVALKFQGLVAIRSTIHPNFYTDYLADQPLRIVMFPEFMVQRGELNNYEPWIVVLGSDDKAERENFTLQLIRFGYCEDLFRYSTGTALQAIVTKLAANATLAAKVITFNAIYATCQTFDLDFEAMRYAITADKRIGWAHSYVPSPDDDQLGFGGHCLPKDIKAMADIDPTAFFETVDDINRGLGRQ